MAGAQANVQSPPCPECGSTQGRHVKKGRDMSDEYVLRYRRCPDCGTKFTTAEATVPDGNFWELDYVCRDRQRELYRRQNPVKLRTRPRTMVRKLLSVKTRVTERAA